MNAKLKRLRAALIRHALSRPEATEDHPWGETVAKVRGKVFVFFGLDDEGSRFTVKLPQSGPFARDLPFVQPTGYGLGRSGWVTATLTSGDELPLEHLKGWIDESYRAVAPKKLAALL